MHKLVIAGIAALLGGQFMFTATAEADHRRHWFFGSYDRYDDGAFDYRSPPRLYRPRRPIAEYGYEDEDGYDAVQPKRRAAYPWRERRVRYDLSPKLRNKATKQRRLGRRNLLASPPVPREKPYAPYSAARSGDVDTAPLSNASKIARPAAKAIPVGTVSCNKAQEIVAGFGFSDIRATSCNGATYSFAAKRDGKPFTVKLSSLNGELTGVERQ